MKSAIRATLVATAVALSLPTLAQQAPAPQVVDAGAVADSVTITGKITAIDKANRTVTVQGPKGRSAVLAVDPSVTRFDSVKVGDLLVVKYFEAVAVSLDKTNSAIRETTQTEPVVTKMPGDKPGGYMTQQTTITANVVAVDAKKQIVTLKGPKGNLVDLKVKDPAVLKGVKAGQQVKAVYTQALAIAVEDAPKPAAKK